MSDCNEHQKTGTLTTPERNRYFYGKLLDESSLCMEQSYFNQKRWMMNRLGLGSGVLCGLNVVVRGDCVCIAPGVAIDTRGHEILVSEPVSIDLRKVTDERGVPTGEEITDGEQGYVCLAYRECLAEPVPVLVTDCDSTNQQAPSVIKESFCVIIKKGPAPALPAVPDKKICDALGEKDPEEKRRKLCEALLFRTCSVDDDCACVVLADIAREGDKFSVTQCRARPLVYSNPELFEMLMCLSEREGGGSQGPAGSGIDLVVREDRLCTEPPTVRLDGTSPNRTLYLGIPPGCAGAPGPEGPGISQVIVNPLPCEKPPTAKLDPDPQHLPHQILTLGLPGHCDQSLTKITDINWVHDGLMNAQDFLDHGLKVTFSAPVTASRSNATPESVNGWFQVSAEVWSGQVNRGGLMVLLGASQQLLPWWVSSGLSLGAPGSLPVMRVHGEAMLAANEAVFMPKGMPYDMQIPGVPVFMYSPDFYMTLYWLNALFLDRLNKTPLHIAIRVTLKTDFLLDKKQRAVDGNHIGGRLPTGDGVQGGDFESWFRLTAIGELKPPKDVVMNTRGSTRKKISAKAAEAELGTEVLARMLRSVAELETFLKRGN